MKRTKVLSQAPAKGPISSTADPEVMTLATGLSPDLTSLGAGDNLPASSDVARSSADREAVFKSKFSAAIGCKSSEMAMAMLDQLVRLEHPTATTDQERISTVRMNAIASLCELQPKTATEALLAAQMVGAQRLAMTFLARAMLPGQTFDGVERNVVRATRLMRLFNEQVETMEKLKGKSGQQRVVVEHVTVAAGGQAIVGSVIPGGRGTGAEH